MPSNVIMRIFMTFWGYKKCYLFNIFMQTNYAIYFLSSIYVVTLYVNVQNSKMSLLNCLTQLCKIWKLLKSKVGFLCNVEKVCNAKNCFISHMINFFKYCMVVWKYTEISSLQGYLYVNPICDNLLVVYFKGVNNEREDSILYWNKIKCSENGFSWSF